MTKKEEIKEFIIQNITEDNLLYCDIIYLNAMELEGELVHVPGSRYFLMTKEQVETWIDEKYNDDLIGHCGDNVMLQIYGWTTVARDEEQEVVEE